MRLTTKGRFAVTAMVDLSMRQTRGPVTLAAMQANAQVVLRYCTPEGKVTPEANPNGSLDNIAGIINSEGNVLGMMPHPERCAEDILGNKDGKLIFQSLLKAMKVKV